MNQTNTPPLKRKAVLYSVLTGIATLVFLCGIVFLAWYAPAKSFPSEDAAILFQYSENLAQHATISYNIESPPAEGATDFLWMFLIAMLNKAGIPAFFSANILSAIGLIGSGLILSKLTGRIRPGLFILFTATLILLPPYFAAVQGFSPCFFGFFILLSLLFYTQNRTILLALSALLTCLIRPDGLVFAAPLCLFFIMKNKQQWKRTVILLTLFTGIPGLLYFFWRAHYFGLLLPLPFYVKSHFDRFLIAFNKEALLTNIHFVFATTPLLLGAILAAKRAKQLSSLTRILLALLAVPFLFYSCMHLEQNIAYRFQYPLLLIPLALAASTVPMTKKPSWVIPAALCMIIILTPQYAVEGYRTLCIPAENVPYISMDLGTLLPGRIATTEAGRLPYYSKWETIDLWGLNTPDLARRVVSPEDIIHFNPDLIVLHTGGDYYGDDWRFLIAENLTVHSQRNWSNMVENTYIAARDSGFQLLMVPHRNTQQRRSIHDDIAKWRPAMKKRFGYKGTFDTHYAFLINTHSAQHKQIQDLLLRHGAMDFQTYRQRKQAFIKE